MKSILVSGVAVLMGMSPILVAKEQPAQLEPRPLYLVDDMQGTPDWRTELYSQTGTLITHAESAALFKQYRVKATPELKSAKVPMPYGDFSQEKYAQKLIDELKQAGFTPKETFVQSFNLEDIVSIDNIQSLLSKITS